jgi:hypothetical protein
MCLAKEMIGFRKCTTSILMSNMLPDRFTKTVLCLSLLSTECLLLYVPPQEKTMEMLSSRSPSDNSSIQGLIFFKFCDGFGSRECRIIPTCKRVSLLCAFANPFLIWNAIERWETHVHHYGIVMETVLSR